MLIPTLQNTKTVTDLRENTLNLLHNVHKLGYVYIFHRSHPKAVVLSIDEFVKIQAMLEDYMDQFEIFYSHNIYYYSARFFPIVSFTTSRTRMQSSNNMR